MSAETRSGRRIFGLETEYGIAYNPQGGRVLSPEEVARYLFASVVEWGRSSNVFLPNASRLYLDVGSHPEYATAECDSLPQLIAHDRGGDLVMEDLIAKAQAQLAAEGVTGQIHLFKNNTDSAGNSYGAHENYLLRRAGDFARSTDILVPFLITRQLLTGAGKVLDTPQGTIFALSQRSDHIWDAVSSATTRSRPIINSRDEPHADASQYRRLHVIVGDSSMAEATTMLKFGSMDLVLRLIEAGQPMKDFTLENPMRAIREISHEGTGKTLLALKAGGTITAIDLQYEYLNRVVGYLERTGASEIDQQVVDLWRRGLEALEAGDMSTVATELDWVIKRDLIDRYRTKHGLQMSDPRVARLDLAYHDISPKRGLYHLLARRGGVHRLIDDGAAAAAVTTAPQTTRAKLRGDFITAARAAGRDYTVDWVHLKINDYQQTTLLCKDPFAAADERVAELIAEISGSAQK